MANKMVTIHFGVFFFQTVICPIAGYHTSVRIGLHHINFAERCGRDCSRTLEWILNILINNFVPNLKQFLLVSPTSISGHSGGWWVFFFIVLSLILLFLEILQIFCDVWSGLHCLKWSLITGFEYYLSRGLWGRRVYQAFGVIWCSQLLIHLFNF